MTADNPMDIKINAKANANFDHILKAIPKGLAKLCYLFFGKREADIARYQMLIAAQTERDYQQVVSGASSFQNGHFIQLQSEASIDSLNPLQIEERQEIENLSKNMKIAAEALRNVPDENISDKPIDDDFFARWRREAKVIGNEELQRLWGRLLAEEIIMPGQVSLRTLDVLKNIASFEAKIFRKIAPHIESGQCIACMKDDIPEDVTITDIMTLKDAGLLLTDDNLYFKRITKDFAQGKPGQKAALFKGIAIVSMQSVDLIKLPGIPLSTAGIHALRICDYDPPNLEQIKYICRILATRDIDNAKGYFAYKEISPATYEDKPFYDNSQESY